MTAGENIKRIRLKKGLTQRKLGELCGINEANIRKYESGKQNPKIETVDRIASALGVNIIDIMDQFTIEQYKTTTEFKNVERESNACEGIIAILTDIYGKVEYKELVGKYGSGCYYLVGEGTEQFIIYDSDIETLYKSTRASIPPIIDAIKEKNTEEVVIREYMKDLDTPPSPDMIPDRFKNLNS